MAQGSKLIRRSISYGKYTLFFVKLQYLSNKKSRACELLLGEEGGSSLRIDKDPQSNNDQSDIEEA
jgi:hypothetical protein